jgi:RNA polymerase sigma factor (sigma-70 family)
MLASQGKIFELLKRGKDDDAIRILYAEVFPKIKKYIKKNNGSLEDAQDAFQEGISIFYKQWHLGKLDQEKDLESYIFIISRNVWLNMLHKNKKNISNIDMSEHEHIESDVDALNFIITEERNLYIGKLLEALGTKCKEMLLSTIFYKKSMAEIVVEMGYANENAAKSTNYRCKQKLIDLIQGKTEIRNLMTYE